MRDSSPLAKWWAEEGEAELLLILWVGWDPIGMVPRDEYDWYVPQIWSMLRARKSKEEIAEQLGEFRTGRMGLPADPRRDLEVARKLEDWIDPPGIPKFRPIDLFE